MVDYMEYDYLFNYVIERHEDQTKHKLFHLSPLGHSINKIRINIADQMLWWMSNWICATLLPPTGSGI